MKYFFAFIALITTVCFAQYRGVVYPPGNEKGKFEFTENIIAINQYSPRDLCTNDQLPLAIFFSDYTVDSRGRIVNDGGWTQPERDLYRGFICKMMPILVELYGLPFEKYNLTIIKDLRYANSNVFEPSQLSIRTSGTYWSPQLLTHELLHAFRGRWHLTTANNSSQYSPTLSGYEEGFAQGVSYEAMNAYIDFYGPDQYISQQRLWIPDNEWDYDYRNDSSMTTEDFWSEYGGTFKYYERYEQAATAIQQLNVMIPNFYARFNQLYYQKIRTVANFSPTKQNIDQIILELSEDANVLNWIRDQNIFDCETIYGKKIYTITNKNAYLSPWYRIHFVETFPNKNEWYYRIPNLGYLYHRLNYNLGYLNVYRTWNSTPYTQYEILNIKDLTEWNNDQTCDVNCTKGFGAEDLMFYFGATPPRTRFNNPLLLTQPNQSGLYRLNFTFINPNYNITPDYNIFYDRTQDRCELDRYEILGLDAEVWNHNTIFGGITNLTTSTGHVKITHSLYPNTSVIANINRGIFVTAGLSQWFFVYRNVLSKKPGTLTFEIIDAYGKSCKQKRYITYGNAAKHKFLLNFSPSTQTKISSTGPE